MSAQELSYTKPEGCQAAAVFSESNLYGKGLWSEGANHMVVRLVCGERSAVCTEDYRYGNFTNPDYRNEAKRSLGAQVTGVLGGMCVGCPNNTSREKTTIVSEQPRDPELPIDILG